MAAHLQWRHWFPACECATIGSACSYQSNGGTRIAGQAVNLVEDHELISVACEIKIGLGQPGAIRIGFEIEIERRALFADPAR
jgi:hypothetical protein